MDLTWMNPWVIVALMTIGGIGLIIGIFKKSVLLCILSAALAVAAYVGYPGAIAEVISITNRTLSNATAPLDIDSKYLQPAYKDMKDANDTRKPNYRTH